MDPLFFILVQKGHEHHSCEDQCHVHSDVSGVLGWLVHLAEEEVGEDEGGGAAYNTTNLKHRYYHPIISFVAEDEDEPEQIPNKRQSKRSKY